jgi:CRP/FNR family transcriptional regulator
MYATTEHSHRRAANILPVVGSNVTSLRETTIASWPQSEIKPPRALTFTPGQTVFFDGDEARHFFEIVSGTLRCCRLTQGGRRQIYRFAGAGEVLGLGGEDIHNYSAEAVTDVVVHRHRLLSLNTAMLEDHQLRERVLQSLRDELAAVRTQLTLLGQMSATEKVVSFLVELSERAADPEGWLHLPMTRCDIADYLGLTIETVSRKISELKRLHLIEMKSPNEIRIAEHDRLFELAEAA